MKEITVALVGLILMFVIPISLYLLGTLEGVNFSSMAVPMVYLGMLLTIVFIAVAVLKENM